VIDVIHEQPSQGDFLAAPDPAGHTLALLRHAPGDVEDVRIIGPSEVDQTGAGELFATEAAHRKPAGIVIDGTCRDPLIRSD
jgi:regulator of RNase E activity RraA